MIPDIACATTSYPGLADCSSLSQCLWQRMCLWQRITLRPAVGHTERTKTGLGAVGIESLKNARFHRVLGLSTHHTPKGRFVDSRRVSGWLPHDRDLYSRERGLDEIRSVVFPALVDEPIERHHDGAKKGCSHGAGEANGPRVAAVREDEPSQYG
jgi:hypothetical protein